MRKVFLSILTICIVVLLILSNKTAFAVEEKDYNSITLQFESSLNEKITSALSPSKLTVDNIVDATPLDANTVKIHTVINTLGETNINDFVEASGIVSFEIGGKKYSVHLSGRLFSTEDDNGVCGYVGGLNGLIYNDRPATYRNGLERYVNNEYYMQRVVLDINYIPKSGDNFSTLTIGSIGQTVPTILFFGDYTDALQKITAKYIKISNTRSAASDIKTDTEVTAYAVDGDLRFQSKAYVNTSNGYVACVSLYHANELRNQGNMTVAAKVNSNSLNFRNYLKYSLGFNVPGSTIITYPDSFNIEIVGADGKLHSTRSVAPNNSQTTVNFPLTVYIPRYGWITIDIPITMSSTSVAYRPVAVNPIFSDSIVTWDIFKRYGWNLQDMDFVTANPEKENTGMRVKSIYTYEGNVTNSFKTSMGAYGSIRYEYSYYLPGVPNPSISHMWTSEALTANSLTIVP
jgi:hypothetical protein